MLITIEKPNMPKYSNNQKPGQKQKPPTMQSTMHSTGDNWMQIFTDTKIKIPDGILSPKNSHNITRGIPTPMRVSTQVSDSKVF
jgi:hypothetical protein